MTYKISFRKTLREFIRHHLASVLAVCLLFFIKLTTFFLQLQNLAFDQLKSHFTTDRLTRLTEPGYGITLLAIAAALILAFDLFRYLHVPRQVDFFESLPIRRRRVFFIRLAAACLVFTVPLLLCFSLEVALLAAYRCFRTALLINLLWSLACMLLIFLANLLTGVLAMILTGHPVVALFGFGTLCVYAPILLQYLIPAYESQYFHTFLRPDSRLRYLNYFSPAGASLKLSFVHGWVYKEHTADFLAILILIALVGTADYLLFKKRPAEAAGRAMAFPKYNPLIRILLVVPLTLYVGLYLSQIVVSAKKVWMVFGFAAAAFLFHGIIESIFQFDIRGLWSHKLQMLGCFAAAMVFALVFWNDLFHYDTYIPDQKQLASIKMELFDSYTPDTENADGISGDTLPLVYELAEKLAAQKNEKKAGLQLIRMEYHLKNGVVKCREYNTDLSANRELIDQIYATQEYKDDICSLYRADWDELRDVSLSDGHTTISLGLSDEERDQLFQTYLSEFTALTYTQRTETPAYSWFFVEQVKCGDTVNYGINGIYRSFTKTIALLDSYIQQNPKIRHFGSTAASPLDKYEIRTLDIYDSDGSPVHISDQEAIQAMKDHILLYDYDDHDALGLLGLAKSEDEAFYEVQVEFLTEAGYSYSSGVIPKEAADPYK